MQFYYFDTEKCNACSRKGGCYKDGTKAKTYSVSISAGEQKRQMEFIKTYKLKAKARE